MTTPFSTPPSTADLESIADSDFDDFFRGNVDRLIHHPARLVRRLAARLSLATSTVSAQPRTLVADKQDAIERALQAFEDKNRGAAQAHLAAQLIAEIRASIDAAAPAAEETPAEVLKDLVAFQAMYGKNTLDADGMPGNDHYSGLLMAIVVRARQALHL